MQDHDLPTLLGVVALMLITARLVAALSERLGQPAVLGEMLVGVLLGGSVLGLVHPEDPVIHFLSEVGVIILLFQVGLETDLRQLLKVGGAATAVAVVGVVVPFALGYGICHALDLPVRTAVTAGAALTATSVGITARVLGDLGRLQEAEGQIILGAAVLDDVLGLVILNVVGGLEPGGTVTAGGVAWTAAVAFGFLGLTLVLGRLAVPRLLRLKLPLSPTLLAVGLAFGLAWLAFQVGSAVIIGAFAAGLLLAESPLVKEVERDVEPLGHFFVPLFFVAVGAAVDVSVFNPLDPANRGTLLVGGLLVLAAVAGKVVAGYAPFWFRGNKLVVGVGMVPRGEVGLIFAQRGLQHGVFDARQFGAITLMVLVTTFLTPPLLKYLFPARPGGKPGAPPADPGAAPPP